MLFSLGADRSSVDAYWRAMRVAHPATIPVGQAAYIRGTDMRTAIESVMRGLKVGDALFRHEVHEAVRGRSGRSWNQHERVLDRLRQERAERDD